MSIFKKAIFQFKVLFIRECIINSKTVFIINVFVIIFAHIQIYPYYFTITKNKSIITLLFTGRFENYQ